MFISIPNSFVLLKSKVISHTEWSGSDIIRSSRLVPCAYPDNPQTPIFYPSFPSDSGYFQAQ
ncbi:hypothetical protein N7447_000202 [Penicillium robsamsonii]|uniref:uncharacterized protein n=1 Tax=Penicillium robsamsonii TaxID=1792511 RepID=UPI0025493E6E|nr:uncharacterized protein N7447_000202 [Penicillium robsamsonii]KAJ5834176.1 hypothetical protein N7447_000202 [Penicillium robsamsonii]